MFPTPQNQKGAISMKRLCLVVLAVFCVGLLASAAEKSHLRARLLGVTEVPTTVSQGTGSFTATINNDSSITYTLKYNNMSTPVLFSHIHIGGTKTTGKVSIFL